MGSSNLTQGGLYGNHEASVVIHLDLTDPASNAFRTSLVTALDRWQTPGAACRRVDAALIQELYDAGDLLSEVTIAAAARAARAATRRGSAASTAGRPPRFGSSGTAVLPPPPPALPPMAPLVVTPSPSPSTVSTRPAAPRPLAPAAAPPTAHQTLLIEVRPHHNGEVFLSKLAVNEDPGFFGFPFSGWATPKSTTRNPVPYPMASADPRVEIVVHDHRGRAVITMRHALNVVYYSRKHEIRVTIPREPLGRIPEMSLLVMTRNPAQTLDYRLEFYPRTCNTLAVRALRAKLTTALPSGGSPQRRHYGWA